MSYFVDTHTHLYSAEFDADRTEMIQRALDANVQKLLLPNIDLESLAGMYELEQQFPKNCHAMLGLHPCSVDENYKTVLDTLYQELQKRKFLAIGEIGIDLYWDKTFLNEQKDAFKTQIAWSKAFGIPFVIHARDSFTEIYEVLDEVWDDSLKGVFHCFTGTLDDVEKINTYKNMYFGIGGVSTFKKSDLPNVIPAIPTERLLLETDSPYLAPTPKRGKRNESSYIPLIADNLATILQKSVEEVRDLTTQNAQNLFNF
ncbi:MAG TPA: TatD family hydrolase [Crocinitomicaceae bacterium]|nr:TatD family hydrolase [Crocinitomicaceae bacterium]